MLRSTAAADDAISLELGFNGESETRLPALPAPPRSFGVGLIVGRSASGKTAALRALFPEAFAAAGAAPEWDEGRAIVSQVGRSPDDAIDRLMSVGLNSIPTWLRPFHSLSNGERNRASLARALLSGALIDGFGNQMDEPTAACMAACIGRFARRSGFERVVIATSHARVARWLQPDWIIVVTPRAATLITRPPSAPPPAPPTAACVGVTPPDGDAECGGAECGDGDGAAPSASGCCRRTTPTPPPPTVASRREPSVEVTPLPESAADLTLGREQDRAPPRPAVLTLARLDAYQAARRARALADEGAASAAAPCPTRQRYYATDPARARELRVSVAVDAFTVKASEATDCEFDGTSVSRLPALPDRATAEFAKPFDLGLVVGPSGSGKTCVAISCPRLRLASGAPGVIHHQSALATTTLTALAHAVLFVRFFFSSRSSLLLFVSQHASLRSVRRRRRRARCELARRRYGRFAFRVGGRRGGAARRGGPAARGLDARRARPLRGRTSARGDGARARQRRNR